MAVTAAASQISCFPSISRKFQLQRRAPSCSFITLRSKLSIVMSLEAQGTDATSSEVKGTLNYSPNGSKPSVEGTREPYPSAKEPISSKMEVNESLQDPNASQEKRVAKIHDFCFGIPYGGLVLSSGLLAFIFSRNPANLWTGMLFGGAVLGLSTSSLKIWRQGKSSLPFILGQAALSAGLLWKSFQAYAMTKKVFPSGFYAIISAAMLCFYSYVMLSGGNPPPKKLKPSVNSES